MVDALPLQVANHYAWMGGERARMDKRRQRELRRRKRQRTQMD